MLLPLTGPLRLVSRLVFETLRPHDNATSSEIRRNGAACVFIGLALLGGSLGLLFALSQITIARPALVPLGSALAIVAEVLMAVGGYRVLTGREPTREEETWWAPVRRVAIYVLSVLSIMWLIFGLLYLLVLLRR